MSPADRFHQIWEIATANFYDPARMGNWDAWLTKFDGQIRSEADALRCANEMLKSLNDPYTIVLGPQDPKDGVCWETGECVGVGIRLLTAYENVSVQTCKQNSSLTGASCRYPTIAGVIYNSPAAQANLKAGDKIVSIDDIDTAGKPMTVLMKALHGKHGSKVKLEILSGSSTQQSRSNVAQSAAILPGEKCRRGCRLP